MPRLTIALGYRTEHRNSEPVVLFAGFDRTKVQPAIDAAPPEFPRFEVGSFLAARKARRNGQPPAATEPVEVGGPPSALVEALEYAKLENAELLEKLGALEKQLAEKTPPAAEPSPSFTPAMHAAAVSTAPAVEESFTSTAEVGEPAQDDGPTLGDSGAPNVTPADSPGRRRR